MQPLGMATIAPPTTTIGADLADLAAVLLDTATDRVDAALNFAAYAQAAARCVDFPMTLSSVTSIIPQEVMPNAARTARNLLTTGQFQEDRLRDALATAMAPADVHVVRLEYADAIFPDTGWGILSLHDVAPGKAAPLDWYRVSRGNEDEDDAVRAAVCRLLDRLVRRVRPQGASTPIIGLDQRLGGCPLIRAVVAERVPEHGFVVDRRYARERLIEDVYQQRRAVGGISASFGDWPIDEPPRPLPVKHDGRLFDEFAVPFASGAERHVALVRPHIVGNSRLTGRKREHRAAAIGAALGHLRPETMADRLRIDHFRTNNDVLWQRHALLVSVLHDRSTGLLAPSAESKARVHERLGARS